MVTKIQQLGQRPKIQSDDEGRAHYYQFQSLPVSDLVPIAKVDLALAVPNEVLLGSLRDGRLRVHSPIKVKFATEGKYIIAEAKELNEFGFGENPSAALTDLQRVIAELYFTLEEEQDNLGKDLQDVWADIQKKIHKHDNQGT